MALNYYRDGLLTHDEVLELVKADTTTNGVSQVRERLAAIDLERRAKDGGHTG